MTSRKYFGRFRAQSIWKICFLLLSCCGPDKFVAREANDGAPTSGLTLANSIDASKNIHLTAEKLGPTTFRLNWLIDNSMPAAQYNDGFSIQIKSAGEFSEWKRILTTTARREDLTGLAPGATYVFRVGAVRRNDVMRHSDLVLFVTDTVPIVTTTTTQQPITTTGQMSVLGENRRFLVNRPIFISWYISISSLGGIFTVAVAETGQCDKIIQTREVAGSNQSVEFNGLPIGTYSICLSFKAAGGQQLTALNNGTRFSVLDRLPENFKLTTTSLNGIGGVSLDPPGERCSFGTCRVFEEGTEVTITPVPYVNYLFTGWHGIDCTTPVCKIKMDGNKTVTANFAEDPNPPARKFIVLGDSQVVCRNGYVRQGIANHCDCNDRADHRFVGCTFNYPKPPQAITVRYSTQTEIKINGVYVGAHFVRLECNGEPYPLFSGNFPGATEVSAMFVMSKDWSCRALYSTGF